MKRVDIAWNQIGRLSAMFCAIGICASVQAAATRTTGSSDRKISVILDTDIGDDIDDTWALGLLLKSPELDLKLAVGEFGRTEYRAKLIAKFLQTVGRTDVSVGVGIKGGSDGVGGQAEWVHDYQLTNYPGKVYQDGVQAMIDTIMRSRRPITLICIGPLSNIAEALRREPRIAAKTNLVGMEGSVRLGYDGSKTVSQESNVVADAKSAQAVLSARWRHITLTPLDTCGLVRLKGGLFERVRDSQDPVARTIIENYRLWSKHGAYAETQSSVLFDPVAVYLAMHQEFCKMENLKIKVTEDGYTVIDPSGRPMSIATSWANLEGYKQFLVERLTGR